MRTERTGWVIFAGTLFVALSCDDNQAPQLEHRPFEGIRLFDENCMPSGGDTTDFVPRPIITIDTTAVPPSVGLPLNYSLVAACPNPASASRTVVEFVLPREDFVWLLVYDRTNSPPIDTLYARMSPAGTHEVLWSNPGADGVFRVEMTTGSGFTSHGDVQFTSDGVGGAR